MCTQTCTHISVNAALGCPEVSVCVPLTVLYGPCQPHQGFSGELRHVSVCYWPYVTRVYQVTGVSPKEGSTEGGTRLTIRGSNLGCDKDDVVGLFVCGSNVLSTLEYVSSSKLICTTKAHKPCTGSVMIETQIGGRGVSLVHFTFIDVVTKLPVGVSVTETCSDSTSECSSSLSRSSSRGDADVKREPSVKVTANTVVCLSYVVSFQFCIHSAFAELAGMASTLGIVK